MEFYKVHGHPVQSQILTSDLVQLAGLAGAGSPDVLCCDLDAVHHPF